MKGKIIQIATMPEGEKTNSCIWVLTDEGEVYFLVMRENKWRRQELPQGEVEVQKLRPETE